MSSNESSCGPTSKKSRVLVAQYEEGQAFFRKRIEDHHYEVGRLDERLDTRND
jgi:hypothetical protein